MPNSIRSPQADILDTLIWSRLSSFWKKHYDPSDLEALNAVYEGSLQALDAEYVRLFEINSAKSVIDTPVHSQRRWLRLDLNRYNELAAFLRFLKNDTVTGTGTSGVADSATLECAENKTIHARHWHIQFPYTIPSGDPITRSTLELSYPTDLSLVTVHKMVLDPSTSRLVGLRLKPGIDYTILPSQTTLRINGAMIGDRYEVNVAFDLSSTTYDGLAVRVAYAAGSDRIASNIVDVPVSLTETNLPMHAMVARNVVDVGNGGLLDSNTATFTTSYEFYPYTGTSDGPLRGAAAGQVVLPSSVNLSSNDAVFVFGLERGDWVLSHRHDIAQTFLNPGAVPGQAGARAAGTTSEIDFSKIVPPGIFGSLGYLGQTLEVYLNGKLLDRSEYQFTSDNRLRLKTPVSWAADSYVTADVRFSNEYEAIQAALGDQHLHYVCVIALAAPPKSFATLDDGGTFDDGGVLDDSIAINVLYITDALANLDTLELFINGVYGIRDVDYFPSRDTSGRILLSFADPIDGKSVITTYRRDVRTYVYGDFAEVSAGQRNTLSGLLTDVQGLIDSFGATYAYNSQNVGRLVEAAAVAAAGGNPFLTLFFDEYEEYADLPIDAEGQPITSFDARTIESYNTDLASIPFLVDHVLHPTVRLVEGQDYDVIDGSMLSSVNLLAKRGPDDSQPGVWWCPLVLLDERMLAQNFGALIGDVQPSSQQYKQSLTANLNLRYSGPIVKNLEWALATLLGSPAFTQDSTIVSTNQELVAHRITVGNESSQQIAVIPANKIPLPVGSDVVPTQSLTQPPLFDGDLTLLRGALANRIVLDTSIRGLRAGDVVRLTLVNPSDPAQTEIVFQTRLLGAIIEPDYLLPRTTLILKDTPRFPVTATSHLLILRQAGDPVATITGTVLSVEKVLQYVVRTTQESFTLLPDQIPEYRPGEAVFRGQPLFPSYAVVYDDATRPNWHWLSPEDFRTAWGYAARRLGANISVAPRVDQRSATVEAADEGEYSKVVLSPLSPRPERGAKIVFTDQSTADEFTFTVVGSSGANVLVTPSVSGDKTGNVIITGVAVDGGARYFENATPPQSAVIETELAYPQLVRSSSIQVADTADFPDAGRVVVRLPSGGATEFTYHHKADGFLLQCEWPEDFPALTAKRLSPTVPGLLQPMLPQDSVLRLVSAFSTRRLNPAFVSLVSARAKQAHGVSTIPVTAANADDIYALLKTSSAVFESRSVSRPAAVTDVVTDLTPSGSTLVAVNKHVVVDSYIRSPGDVTDQFHEMALTISPTPVADVINLPAGSTSVTLSVSISDPDSASPYTYLWTQEPVSDEDASFATPLASSTPFTGLEDGKTYYAQVVVTNAQGHTATANVRIVVAA